MSLQASAVHQAMRVFGNMLVSSGEPAQLREKIHGASKRMPAPPKEARYEEVRIADNLPAYWITMPDSDPNKVLLFLHGGGYMFGGTMFTHKDLVWRLAKAAQCPVLSVEYRLAPENPYPAPQDDCFSAYQWLTERYSSRSIAIAGDSAGGGLTFATLLRAKDEGLPLPAAVVGMSPWTDLACTGESVVTNAPKDVLIPGEGLKEGIPYILNGADPLHPYASPLYGDYTGCCPALIQVGSEEVLLDDSRRLAYKMEASGVPVVLDVWNRMPHVWQVMSMILPEGRVAIDRIGVFLRGHMRSIPLE
jgi:monoterpene epsilon-lactone hydrolase